MNASMTSTTALFVLLAWIPVVLMLFAVLRARSAVLWSFVVGWLFLPMADNDLPGLPDFDKLAATSVAALLGVLVFDHRSLLRYRPSWADLPLLAWCFVPMLTSIFNDLGPYDGLSASWGHVVRWGIPIFLGRIYFNDFASLREVAIAIVVGGVLYVPLCWIEIQLSPQLHTWIYGYFQHNFRQTMRYGGFRPVVFLQNGLAVAALMSVSATMTFWLWRCRSIRGVRPSSLGWLFLLLAVTTVFCKSANGVVLMVLGLVTYAAVQLIPPRWVLIPLLLAVPTYMVTRATGVLPAHVLVDLATPVDVERAGSLRARLEQEDLFSKHTWQRPLFGWGGWKRNFPTDEFTGEQLTRGVDSFWIIALSKNGIVGLMLATLTLLIGPAMFLIRCPQREWFSYEVGPATALTVCIILYVIDNLFNGLVNLVFFLPMGGLISIGLRPLRAWRPATTRPRRGRDMPRRRLVTGEPGSPRTDAP